MRAGGSGKPPYKERVLFDYTRLPLQGKRRSCRCCHSGRSSRSTNEALREAEPCPSMPLAGAFFCAILGAPFRQHSTGRSFRLRKSPGQPKGLSQPLRAGCDEQSATSEVFSDSLQGVVVMITNEVFLALVAVLLIAGVVLASLAGSGRLLLARRRRAAAQSGQHAPSHPLRHPGSHPGRFHHHRVGLWQPRSAVAGRGPRRRSVDSLP